MCRDLSRKLDYTDTNPKRNANGNLGNNMSHILEIQKILNCTIEHARKVFDEMCASNLDFSECSKRAFKAEVFASNLLIK